MLLQRVERIEEDIREIRNDIRDLRTQGHETLQTVHKIEVALEQQFNKSQSGFDHAMHKIDLSLERMEGATPASAPGSMQSRMSGLLSASW